MPHCPELLLPQAHSLPAFLASDSMFIASIGRDHCHALLPRHLIGRARLLKRAIFPEMFLGRNQKAGAVGIIMVV